MDYATPIAEPILKRYISRHRLSRQRPLTYYLDRGTPEPVWSAPLDGARWWSEAFTAAGWPDGFRVEVMPEDAGPMDVRYNVIQWVHRSTRGWPYGGGVTDPRTGEIIQGRVTLGSLRVRQDYLIAEGLLAHTKSGKPVNPAMEKMALQRLRQLAAHEVGHTRLSFPWPSCINKGKASRGIMSRCSKGFKKPLSRATRSLKSRLD